MFTRTRTRFNGSQSNTQRRFLHHTLQRKQYSEWWHYVNSPGKVRF